jgi:hypothetical protein
MDFDDLTNEKLVMRLRDETEALRDNGIDVGIVKFRSLFALPTAMNTPCSGKPSHTTAPGLVFVSNNS